VGSTLIGMAALVGWPSVAGATYSGHNGDVLVRSPAPVGLGEAGPDARGADCLGFASGRWAVRADGTRPIDVGWGDSGMFSPQGLRLAIAFLGDPCYGYGGGRPGRIPAAACSSPAATALICSGSHRSGTCLSVG
jgi:hypothetical protein